MEFPGIKVYRDFPDPMETVVKEEYLECLQHLGIREKGVLRVNRAWTDLPELPGLKDYLVAHPKENLVKMS
jgi:hypothetical protein